jgi:c-di-GMP-binding flagellar brake protein YcgR
VRRIDGSRAGFATHIVERTQGSDGVDNYRVVLPASVDYRQRREVFRLSLASDADSRSEFCTADRQYCSALVRDVSPAGICLGLQNEIEVAAGDRLAELDFEFGGYRFRCTADVRHVYSDRFGGTAIGVAFSDFPRAQQRVLERCIMQQQRHVVRQTRAAAERASA